MRGPQEKDLAALQKLVNDKKYADVLKQVFASAAPIQASTPNGTGGLRGRVARLRGAPMRTDINTIMNLSFSLLLNIEAPAVVSDFVGQFARLLTSDKQTPQLKIKLCVVLCATLRRGLADV